MSARSKKGGRTAGQDGDSPVGEGAATSSGSSTTIKRTVTVERQSRSPQATPKKDGSGAASPRSRSPLAVTRNEEKDELAHLNDRLAGYIDFVRSLETDKAQLTKKIQSISESQTFEVTKVKKIYEDEMNALRKMVESLSNERAGLKVEAQRANEAAADAKGKLGKRELECRATQRKVETLEKELAGYRADQDRYPALKIDFDALEKQYDAATKRLEAEVLARTDLENKVTSLREELSFVERLHKEERAKLVQKTFLIQEEVEGRKAAEYESRLSDELRAIRAQTTDELDQYKLELQESFQLRFGELRDLADRQANDSVRCRDEVTLLRKRTDDMSAELASRNAEVGLLQRRVRELEELLATERRDYEAQLRLYREESERLNSELKHQFGEFAELMHTKIALDQEIAVYRAMLEGEEMRCKLSPPQRESPFDHGTKRRRLEEEGDIMDGEGELSYMGAGAGLHSRARFSYRVQTATKGAVEFAAEQDTEGKSVKLVNKSDKDVAIGGWVLKYSADGKEVTHKFHRSAQVKAGADCTVWGSDANKTHNPPTDIVMKERSFTAGQKIHIGIVDTEGQEQASCDMERERARATVLTSGRQRARKETEEKCSLM